MSKSASEIVSEMKLYIDQSGGGYQSWYVGIAEDAKTRLFIDHSVQEQGPYWRYDTAASDADARDAE